MRRSRGVNPPTCNLGASSPSEYGDYYAWGETEPYYVSLDPLVWKTGKESGYAWQSYCGSSDFTEWNPAPYDADGILKPEYDAARQNWGGGWRMPTQAEFQALLSDCMWTWTTEGGNNGYKVTERNDRSNSIFLPTARYFNNTDFQYEGNGYYWSSSLYMSSAGRAYCLFFDSGSHAVSFAVRRCGRSVRPVTE